MDGVLEQRNLGEDDHSKRQLAVQRWFILHKDAWNILVRPELRINTQAGRYRVAVSAILDASLPRERIRNRVR